jgi:hypothetical protein
MEHITIGLSPWLDSSEDLTGRGSDIALCGVTNRVRLFPRSAL